MDQFARWFMLKTFKLNRYLSHADRGEFAVDMPLPGQKLDAKIILRGAFVKQFNSNRINTNDEIETMKQKLCEFEKDVLIRTDSHLIGYHWIKLLLDMIICDRVILSKAEVNKVIKDICPNKNIKKIAQQFLEKNWIFQIHKNHFLINTTITGTITGVVTAQSVQLKSALMGMRFSTTASSELQEFLYFGEKDKFTGLSSFLDFGTKNENDKLSKVGDTENGILSKIPVNKKVSEF